MGMFHLMEINNGKEKKNLDIDPSCTKGITIITWQPWQRRRRKCRVHMAAEKVQKF